MNDRTWDAVRMEAGGTDAAIAELVDVDPMRFAPMIADLIASQSSAGEEQAHVPTIVIERHRHVIQEALRRLIPALLAIRTKRPIKTIPSFLLVRADFRAACGRLLERGYEAMLDSHLAEARQRRRLLVAAGMTGSEYADPIYAEAKTTHREEMAARLAHLDGEHP